MPGNQAREVERAGLGESLEDLTGRLGLQPDRVRVIVFHVGILLHRLHMLEVALHSAYDEFVVLLAIVAQLETNLFTLVHADVIWSESHLAFVFGHDDLNNARWLLGIAGLAEGRLFVFITMAVGDARPQRESDRGKSEFPSSNHLALLVETQWPP